MHEPTL